MKFFSVIISFFLALASISSGQNQQAVSPETCIVHGIWRPTNFESDAGTMPEIQITRKGELTFIAQDGTIIKGSCRVTSKNEARFVEFTYLKPSRTLVYKLISHTEKQMILENVRKKKKMILANFAKE